MKENNAKKYNVTELFLVKADWDRTFIGAVTKNEDNNGNINYGGSVIVEEGKMVASGKNIQDLTNKLDQLCTYKLDGKLHEVNGRSIEIFGVDSYLN